MSSTTTVNLAELISRYEQKIYADTAGVTLDVTIKVLDELVEALSGGGLAERGVPVGAREHWYTRLASALTLYITHPQTRITLDGLRNVCRRKQQIAYIFAASGYRSTTHLIRLVADDQQGALSLNHERAAVLLAFMALDDVTDELLNISLRQPPDVLLILMLGWLNQRAVLTEQGERNRSRLLASGPLISASVPTDSDIGHIVNAWMYSSYASSPCKHDIKKYFNELLRGLVEGLPSAIPDRRPTTSRPKMLILHERFTMPSAMYRCYAPSIRDLKKHFELVAMAEQEHIDQAADEIFDVVARIKSGRKNMKEIIAAIEAFSPDVIYYPSLGMSHWTVLTAQLRLAPVQIMTHGHPATSMSDAIDYVYTCSLDGDVAAIHSEKIILGPDFAVFDPHTDLPTELPPLLPPSEREVRVAVNSKVMKLSHRLIDICVRLQKAADVPVRFSFFPGEQRMFYDGLAPALQNLLPNAEVMPYLDYDRFLAEMCKCDLALAAFPFGNTNSTVDTTLLGLPTVAHFGPESPAQSDRLVMRTAGLPEWLICNTDEQYYTTALRLINSPEARRAAMANESRAALRTRIFNNKVNAAANPFADVLYHIYLNHERLMATPERVFDYRDLLGQQP